MSQAKVTIKSLAGNTVKVTKGSSLPRFKMHQRVILEEGLKGKITSTHISDDGSPPHYDLLVREKDTEYVKEYVSQNELYYSEKEWLCYMESGISSKVHQYERQLYEELYSAKKKLHSAHS